MKHLFPVLFFALYQPAIHAQSPCIPVQLKCEYSLHPLGIDRQDPRFSWRLEDGRQGTAQIAFEIHVSTDSLSLLKGHADAWHSGIRRSSRTNGIVYQGKPLRSRTRYYWQVTVWDKDNKPSHPSAITSFETGIFTYPEWKGEWISDGQDTAYRPAPYFRKTFTVQGRLRSARAYICGPGYYEMSINGKKVGDHVLDPAYTRYDKKSYYCVYDLAPYLQEGQNALGVLLGNGWFNEQSRAVWFFHKAPWRDRPKLLCNLYLEYEDGTTDCVATDSSWRTAASPVIFNNIYSGEYIDHRAIQKGWDQPGFDDAQWKKVRSVVPAPGELRAQLMPPIRVKKEIKPVSMQKWSDSLYVFDLGQNFSGLSRLRVSGERGTIVSVKHGEELSPEGRLNQENISVHYRFADPEESAQTDKYVLAGEGTEEFTQHFTYHGYRYVEVRADGPVRITPDGLTGLFIHTDVSPVGSFSCSDTLINRIYSAGIWSYLSNMQGIPTDCPQREKNGWTGDGHIAAEVGLYNFDAILFYEKWIADFIDEQQRNGEIAPIIPTSGWGYNFHNGVGPVWDAALLLIPWYIYEYYGDDFLIRSYYDQYKKYVDYLRFRADSNNIQHFGLGDWSPYKSRTPIELTSTSYYYQVTLLLSKFARITGRKDDAAAYRQLAEKIRSSINTHLFDKATGLYANGTETALSTMLCQDIVPVAEKQRVLDNLVRAIAQNDNHLDVGMIGSKHLLNALSSNGVADLAFTIASQRTKPSWGWWLLQGETTFQEEWGIGPSRNHIFLGEIVAWFFKALAGIQVDPDRPGFEHIIIRPSFVHGLSFANASVETVHGKVSTAWKRVGGAVIFDLAVPPNATATVYLPGGRVHEVKAGRYHFTGKY
ncbi:glycoside hydrolase family 78 protein [Flavitalea sp. BT771]|uniref:glycoside hydrolase family 78 protein n=1 Tax=Flavitalea sp. BT771 TaxID=3063329 RepID=UPI0026E3548C|nr:glycoside hydrolase family 78 protein [Flavitalea sp. BT771]MDO6433083.1 glycoside hydrolase family 78 protein [Flavitalea sp. BT771]MDV6221641.1 glycoside hydrolase family 78 protein [Flavitalea sp. BT771]